MIAFSLVLDLHANVAYIYNNHHPFDNLMLAFLENEPLVNY